MPRYDIDPESKKFIITRPEFNQLFERASHQEKVALALLWLTGNRAMEIIMLDKDSFTVIDKVVYIKMRVLKKRVMRKRGKLIKKVDPATGKMVKFYEKEGEKKPIFVEHAFQLVDINGDRNELLDFVLAHVKKLGPEERVLKYKYRWMHKRIRKLGMAILNRAVCPHQFRHSWATHYGRRPGAKLAGLKGWRMTSAQSCDGYIQGEGDQLSVQDANNMG